MAEILKKTRHNQGFVLLSSLLVMSLLLLLAIYVINFTLTEFKISISHSTAAQAYYLAESGVAEAIWKLKNDPTWTNSFETDPLWTVSYTREPALYPNGSYTIEIINTGLAQGDIIVTGKMDLGGRQAKRVIKTTAYKALGGTTPIGDNPEFTDGNIDLSGSLLNIIGGSVHANGNVIVNFSSTLSVGGGVRTTGNILVNQSSTIDADPKTEGVDSIPMPSISFDDPDDTNSYLRKANNTYTQSEFDNELWAHPDLTLSGITYVDGNIEIKADQNLVINGTLVANGNIKVGKTTQSCCSGLRCGMSDITINKTAIGKPSGLIAKGRIDFESCLNSFNANGVVYANDKVNILSMPGSFSVNGGVIARKSTLTSIWQGASITYNQENLVNILGGATFSPVVTLDHWEEEY